MRPSSAVPPFRFLLALGLLLVLGVSGLLALMYLPAAYADLDQLRGLRYHDGTFRYLRLALTPEAFVQARRALLLLLGGSGATAVLWWRARGGLYQEWRRLVREGRTLRLLAPWRRLRPAERRTALLLLAALLLVRGYYLLTYPLYGDELVSYQCFVRPGLLAATSFYPIPNNHILYSALCWLFGQLSPNVYWTMRLPTFLLSALATPLVGLLLLRHVSFRVAALTVLLFGFFPYALFQAVVGRGYFLLAASSQVGLVAVLALLRGTLRPRLAWATLLLSSVLGLYAMPTYLLVFGGLYAALGAAWLLGRRWAGLAALALAGLLTALPTLLLYAPVLVVSGPAALFGNGYVAPGAGQAPGLTALTFLLRTEGQLLGFEPLGPLTLLLSALLLGAAYRQPRVRRLLPLLALLWVPYLLLAARGVFPPVRVLSYRMFFLLLAGAQLTELLLQWRPLRPLVVRPALTVALPVLLWAGASLLPFQRRAGLEAGRNARVAQVYHWLRAQGAHRVLADDAHYQVYLPHYSGTDEWPLRVDAVPGLGVTYDFQLVSRDAPAAPDSAAAVFAKADVRVYRLPRRQSPEAALRP
jgi:hypothetical protein